MNNVHHLEAKSLVIGSLSIGRPRRPSASSTLKRALQAAVKAGASIIGATISPDGSVSLQFGNKVDDNKNKNDDWDFMK